jgi:hypothetical protein
MPKLEQGGKSCEVLTTPDAEEAEVNSKPENIDFHLL